MYTILTKKDVVAFNQEIGEIGGGACGGRIVAIPNGDETFIHVRAVPVLRGGGINIVSKTKRVCSCGNAGVDALQAEYISYLPGVWGGANVSGAAILGTDKLHIRWIKGTGSDPEVIADRESG